MKVITVYKLLGLIKDNNAPKIVKTPTYIWTYEPTMQDYLCETKGEYLVAYFRDNYYNWLTCPVEIIDDAPETEFEDIEEITINESNTIGFPNGKWTARNMDKAISLQINQLIRNQKKIIEKIKELENGTNC